MDTDIIVHEFPDVKKVNPKEYFGQNYKSIVTSTMVTYLVKHGIPLDFALKEADKKAEEFVQKQLREIQDSLANNPLLPLLGSRSKKEQQQILKNAKITSKHLVSFIINSFEKHGYLYSSNRFEIEPEPFSQKQKPKLAIRKSSDKIEKYGDTDLKDGELRQLFDQRKVIISKVIENENEWHCIFLTYKGIKGHEQGNLKHFHYISDKWGLSLDKIISELKARKYSLPSLPHIQYID